MPSIVLAIALSIGVESICRALSKEVTQIPTCPRLFWAKIVVELESCTNWDGIHMNAPWLCWGLFVAPPTSLFKIQTQPNFSRPTLFWSPLLALLLSLTFS